MHTLTRGNRPSPLRLAFPFTIIVAMCFAFSPLTQAVVPAPDGGYAGHNTAEGTNALLSLTNGIWNTAVGFEALKFDSTGGGNTAVGFHAMLKNLGGGNNVAVGSNALANNTSGDQNIAIGNQAGINVTTGSNNIHVAHPGISTDDKMIRIGRQGTQRNIFVAGIHGVILPNNGTLQPVFVNDGGQLGTVLSPPPSSARFKEEIKPMGNVSEDILSLKPVTFRYKKDIDPQHLPQFGLVAEEVAKVNPDLVTRDETGQLYTVRYEAVNAMLLNEFVKEHGKVEQLEVTAAQQAKEIQELKAALKEQSAQIQNVSARIELNRPAPKVVLGSN